MTLSPWKQAAEAERRAAAAEDRAAFLEQHIAWMRILVEDSRKAEQTALKIGSNVAHQAAFGFIPFPEVVSVPAREERIRELDQPEESFDPREKWRRDFKESDMEWFKKSRERDTALSVDE